MVYNLLKFIIKLNYVTNQYSWSFTSLNPLIVESLLRSLLILQYANNCYSSQYSI